MYDLSPEVGDNKEKIRPLLMVGVLVLLGLTYYYIVKANANETEVVFETTEPITEIYVDVSGAVNSPGVYRLDSKARVTDILSQAGGVSSQAHFEWVSKNLNLSAKLEDGQKVYVPFEWDLDEDLAVLTPLVGVLGISGTGTTGSNNEQNSEDLINVNTASATDLTSLNGIGDTYAKRIVDNRPYANLDELIAKAGISQNLASKISEFITF